MGVLGAPEAGCGSAEFDCGQASAADNIKNATVANGERFIANHWMRSPAAQMADPGNRPRQAKPVLPVTCHLFPVP